MAQHNETGKTGEDLAADFLAEQGYRILERNWRWGKGEIDLICSRDRFIVFVEVKTRSTGFFGQPEEAVNKTKKRFIIRAANAYVLMNDLHGEVRYDILSVILRDRSHTIRHIEDAFYPTL
jgi:putative endonuclease